VALTQPPKEAAVGRSTERSGTEIVPLTRRVTRPELASPKPADLHRLSASRRVPIAAAHGASAIAGSPILVRSGSRCTRGLDDQHSRGVSKPMDRRKRATLISGTVSNTENPCTRVGQLRVSASHIGRFFGRQLGHFGLADRRRVFHRCPPGGEFLLFVRSVLAVAQHVPDFRLRLRLPRRESHSRKQPSTR
jgi:hypothetical protein